MPEAAPGAAEPVQTPGRQGIPPTVDPELRQEDQDRRMEGHRDDPQQRPEPPRSDRRDRDRRQDRHEGQVADPADHPERHQGVARVGEPRHHRGQEHEIRRVDLEEIQIRPDPTRDQPDLMGPEDLVIVEPPMEDRRPPGHPAGDHQPRQGQDADRPPPPAARDPRRDLSGRFIAARARIPHRSFLDHRDLGLWESARPDSFLRGHNILDRIGPSVIPGPKSRRRIIPDGRVDAERIPGADEGSRGGGCQPDRVESGRPGAIPGICQKVC